MQGWGVRRGCLGQEGPAPTLASSAQMGGPAATSWIGLLTRSLWGDIPFPTGPGKALNSSSLEPAFFLGCGLPPPLQHGWQSPGLLGPRSPSGARSLERLGPGPHSRDQRTVHCCGHYLPWCIRMTGTASPWGQRALGRDDSSSSCHHGGIPQWHSQWEARVFTVGCWALCPCGQQGGGHGAQAGANILLLSAQRAQPPDMSPAATPSPRLQTHSSISSTCSLDPWLSLHCNSSVVHSIFI